MTTQARPIFADDSSPADKRAAAVGKLIDMCPKAYRVPMRPMIEQAIAGASDDMVASLAADIDRVKASAAANDFDAICDVAKRYGATDAMIGQYLPMFKAMAGG